MTHIIFFAKIAQCEFQNIEKNVFWNLRGIFGKNGECWSKNVERTQLEKNFPGEIFQTFLFSSRQHKLRNREKQK